MVFVGWRVSFVARASLLLSSHVQLRAEPSSAVSPHRARPPTPARLVVSRRAMAAAPAQQAPAAHRVVAIPYADLKERGKDLSGSIEAGFGPGGLGVVSVSGVPGYPELRKQLLQLAPRVANLPDDAKEELEDAESRYHIGWSYGKEKLESGEPDTLKGSFFANPILDIPTTDGELMNRYPAYCRPNMWPTNHLPELEVAYKALGRLMLEVGLMLAHHCDLYVRQGVGNSDGDALEQIIGRSRCPKGRLLYYLPRKFSQKTESGGSISSWQGWHTDWGSLTGLTHDLFVRNSVEIPCPDSTAGLYVRTHSNHDVKVIFGEDELAYQIGETTEVLSGGRLCATPHCVKAPNGDDASDVARCTFVMFMQPNWDEKLQFPSEMPYHQELIPPNRELMFGEYSQRRLDKFTAANGGLVAHRLHAT